jgi:hypothetical protein
MSSNQKSDSTNNKKNAQYIPGDHTCHVYYVLNTTSMQTASSTPWVRPLGLDVLMFLTGGPDRRGIHIVPGFHFLVTRNQ